MAIKHFLLKDGLQTHTIKFLNSDTPLSVITLDFTEDVLSFTGDNGQLFSIVDDMTGTIFSVNDISGIPSVEVFDTGEIRFAEFGGQIVLPVVNTPLVPTLSFGADDGFYSPSPAVIRMSIGGANSWEWNQYAFGGTAVRSLLLGNTTPSATIPSLRFSGDATSGVGGIAQRVSLIASNLEILTVEESAAASRIGFHGATPVVKSVALTAEDAAVVDATYGTEESGVINNLRTRVAELETVIQNLGLLA